MVYRSIRFRCDGCHRGYRSYEEAWDCQLDHITADAISGFKDKLAVIFDPDSPAQPPRKSAP